MTSIRAAAESHTGYVRTNNEDLAVVGANLAAVADGMGGHLGGEVAARTAIEQLVEAFPRDATADGLVRAVQEANEAIWRRSRSDPAVHGMGTTVTAAALVPDEAKARRLVLVNVGDSRAYRIDRQSDEPRLSRVTEDHSVVEDMVRAGELSPAEAAVHPHRHVLSRVLGIDPEVDVDLFEIEPTPGLRVLLCSDGLSDYVPEEEIAALLAGPEEPEQAARDLVEAALSHGGVDNVTVAVLDVVDGPEPSEIGPFSFAPPRPAAPDRGEDSLRADITQALPLTKPDESGKDGKDGKDSGEPTAAVDMAALVGAATADQNGSATADTVESPSGAPSAQLFDAEAEEQKARPGGGRQRQLVVRAGAPALLPESGELTGSHSRTTVLVPAGRGAKQYRDRVLTVRVVLFVLVLAAVLGGVVAVIVWFQRSSYYVGFYHGRVSIFQGRKGGLLWFKPQLLEESSLTSHNLLPNSLAEVQKGIAETSYAAARQQVADLGRLSAEVGLAPKSATTTTSTTPAGKSSLGVTPTPVLRRASLSVAVFSSEPGPTRTAREGVSPR